MGVSGLTGDIAAARITNALNASGSAPIYAARAWVNFNGIGTVAINASGNVSSITDNGVGNYTVNFTTAMPDGNYSIGGFGVAASDTNLSGCSLVTLSPSGVATFLPGLKTTTQVRFLVGNPNTFAPVDCGEISLHIFR